MVPATIDLAGAEIELVSLVARENRLAKALAAHPGIGSADVAGDDRLDYVLIDCPPSLGLLTLNALVAGAEVMIPIQAEYYALEGLGQLLETIEMVRAHLNPRLTVSTILITMYDARTRLAAGVADEVREHFADQVLKTTIPRSVRVSEAPSYGQTVMTYDPASPGALSYLEAAREVAQQVTSRDPAEAQHEGPDMSRERTPARRGLGRGLGSLIPTAPTGTPRPSRRRRDGRRAGRARAGRARGQLVRRAAGRADRAQPRAAAAGLRRGRDGRAGPLASARWACSSRSWSGRSGPEQYELVMGERRWRAAQQAGLERIPAIVRATDDTDMLRDALLENLHRSQLNPLEEAAAYQQLLEDFGCTHDELAQRIGRSRPADLQHHPAAQALPGRAAAGGRRRAQRRARAVAARRRGRRPAGPPGRPRGRRGHQRAGPGGDRRRPAARRRPRPPAPRRNKPVAPGLTDLAERLSDRFETRVKVDLGRHKGKITVEFASLDDLRRIVDIMDPRNRTTAPSEP